MTKLKPGDRVDCRVKDGIVVSPYKEYDEVKTFEIVSKDHYGYWLYVPSYWSIKETIIADKSKSKSLAIDKRFLDTEIVYVLESRIYRVASTMEGMNCAKCGEYYRWAEPNQGDGTLICYACRFNPYR